MANSSKSITSNIRPPTSTVRSGSASDHTSYVGLEGEITRDSTTGGLHVHDGATSGGSEVPVIESGTWTPEIAFTTSDVTVVYTTQQGSYAKIGSLVSAFFSVASSAYSFSTATGIFRLTGLPYVVSTGQIAYVGSLHYANIPSTGYEVVVPRVSPGTQYVSFIRSGNNIANQSIAGSTLPSGSQPTLVGTVQYIAAT